MGAGTIFLLIIVIVVALAILAAVTGLGEKLGRDKQKGQLPSQQESDERPEHLAVGPASDDELERRRTRRS